MPERAPADSASTPDRPPARWWGDTLAKRLFVWLWVALVVSHVVAILVTHAVFGSPHAMRPSLATMPVLPALPPTPGLHDTPQRLGTAIGLRLGATTGPALPSAGEAVPPSGPAAPSGPPPLPTRHLLLDYVLRALLLAGFAWAGSRWLARPMGQLSHAARRLAAAPGSATPPHLPERGMAEVRHTAQAFNGMARQLSQHVRERELTMAAISHDLRTPLTRMRLRLERLRDQPGAAACIDDVHEMDALIGQVLSLLRDAQTREAAETLDLPALLQALVDDRAEQGARVSLRGPTLQAGHPRDADAPATLTAPPLALRRLLDNLLDNAIRHGGGADLSWRRDGPAHWCVCIADRGPGLSADELRRALQPWQQLGAADPGHARDARHAHGGSGLGLYIADQLARRLGVTLQWQPRDGGGLRVALRLPRDTPDSATAAA